MIFALKNKTVFTLTQGRFLRLTLESFRITHSTLIEHYQFIEAHLEGIYAALSGKTLWDGLQDVKTDSLNRIINEIKKTESKENKLVFTDEEYEQLKRILKKRNFWCHNCYYDMAFDARTGGPLLEKDIRNLISDLREAEELREELFAKKMILFELNDRNL